MKKQAKQFVILLVILVALAAAFFALKKYNQTQSGKTEEDVAAVVADVNREDIVKFSYVYNGETYTFEKEDGKWYYADDHSLTIVQYKISSMLTAIAPLEAKAVIENVTDMEQYGLTASEKTIQYETKTNAYVFEVGDYNSVSGIYYIRKPSEDTIYAVSPAVVTSFNATLDSLVDEPESTEEIAE